jgi:hypothetical protein
MASDAIRTVRESKDGIVGSRYQAMSSWNTADLECAVAIFKCVQQGQQRYNIL